MMTVLDFILVLALRFILFDFVGFKKIRTKLLHIDNKFLIKLLYCTFCQGVWCSLFIYVLNSYVYNRLDMNIIYFYDLIRFVLCGGILSFSWTVMLYPFYEEFEDINKRLKE